MSTGEHIYNHLGITIYDVVQYYSRRLREHHQNQIVGAKLGIFLLKTRSKRHIFLKKYQKDVFFHGNILLNEIKAVTLHPQNRQLVPSSIG